MKSRDLRTVHDLIVASYQKLDFGNGHLLHTFQSATTDTMYQFEVNFEDVIAEEERHDIGSIEENGRRVVDLSCPFKAPILNKDFSYLYARNMPRQRHDESKGKNDSRVRYQSENGYYWGGKYAWWELGLVLSRDTSESYLIGRAKHPTIECVVETKGYPKGKDFITFKEDGPEKTINEPVDAVVMVSKGSYSKSPLYFSSGERFTIKGVPAITGKK